MHEFFRRVSETTAQTVGTPIALLLALATVAYGNGCNNGDRRYPRPGLRPKRSAPSVTGNREALSHA